MFYMNDCSIRVVQSYVKRFVQVLHTKIILQQKKQITVLTSVLN